MIINQRITVFASALAVIFAFATASFAQMVGGYKVVANTDPGAAAAAEFAVETQSGKTQQEISLEAIVKAERQIVQGSNYRLCLEVGIDGGDTVYVQTVVYVDLKGNRKLSSWANSTCGDNASSPVTTPIKVGGYSQAPKTDAQVVSAAKFAVAAQSEKLDAEMTIDEILSAERQVVQGMNYRLCLRVNVEGDEPQTISAIVYQDLKRNYTLASWKAANCGIGG